MFMTLRCMDPVKWDGMLWRHQTVAGFKEKSVIMKVNVNHIVNISTVKYGYDKKQYTVFTDVTGELYITDTSESEIIAGLI